MLDRRIHGRKRDESRGSLATSASRPPAAQRRIPNGAWAVLEIVLLGAVAFALTAFAVPELFEIESECLTGVGRATTSGATFIDAVMVVGTVGWFAVAITTIYASIADRGRLVLWLPIVWFVGFVAVTLVTGLIVGPATCPS